MVKCDKYHLYYNPVTGAPIRNSNQVGVCWGTKEQHECFCEGNKRNCDFYEHVRNEAKQRMREESLPTRLAELVIKLNSLDLSGYQAEELKRAKIIDELLDIKTLLEKRNT